MNTQNIDKAIAIMERAEKLNMVHWQTHASQSKVAKSIEELHTCGNTACFAGYIAISNEFKADGGEACVIAGAPTINNEHGSIAIAQWLEVPNWIADWFVYGVVTNRTFSLFYDKEWAKVEPSDIIEKLKELKELGAGAFTEKYLTKSQEK